MDQAAQITLVYLKKAKRCFLFFSFQLVMEQSLARYNLMTNDYHTTFKLIYHRTWFPLVPCAFRSVKKCCGIILCNLFICEYLENKKQKRQFTIKPKKKTVHDIAFK